MRDTGRLCSGAAEILKGDVIPVLNAWGKRWYLRLELRTGDLVEMGAGTFSLLV